MGSNSAYRESSTGRNGNGHHNGRIWSYSNTPDNVSWSTLHSLRLSRPGTGNPRTSVFIDPLGLTSDAGGDLTEIVDDNLGNRADDGNGENQAPEGIGNLVQPERKSTGQKMLEMVTDFRYHTDRSYLLRELKGSKSQMTAAAYASRVDDEFEEYQRVKIADARLEKLGQRRAFIDAAKEYLAIQQPTNKRRQAALEHFKGQIVRREGKIGFYLDKDFVEENIIGAMLKYDTKATPQRRRLQGLAEFILLYLNHSENDSPIESSNK